MEGGVGTQPGRRRRRRRRGRGRGRRKEMKTGRYCRRWSIKERQTDCQSYVHFTAGRSRLGARRGSNNRHMSEMKRDSANRKYRLCLLVQHRANALICFWAQAPNKNKEGVGSGRWWLCSPGNQDIHSLGNRGIHSPGNQGIQAP